MTEVAIRLCKRPLGKPFLVRQIFTDFKRHDVGPGFYERNYDGTMQTMFMTRPLWGIDSTGPSGHDGRSMTLDDPLEGNPRRRAKPIESSPWPIPMRYTNS